MSVYIKPKSRQGIIILSDMASGMSLIQHWWSRAVHNWQRRKMIAALAALDDRMLLDIGLCRGQIEDFVDGLSSAELRMAPVAPDLAASMQDLSHAELRRAA